MPIIFINRTVHLVIGYALLLAVLLGSVVSISLPAAQYVSHSDKFVHALTYAILGLWFIQVVPTTKFTALFSALFFYGAIIEIIQGLLPHRSASLLDLFANLFGLLCALIVANFVKIRAED